VNSRPCSVASACPGSTRLNGGHHGSSAFPQWSAWLDPLLVRRLAAGPLDQPASETLDAAVALLDISGFTQLTERLAAEGPIGAEKLQTTLNQCFGKLTARARHHGGEILKFPGDAVLVLWPVHDGETLVDVTHRAKSCCSESFQEVSTIAVAGLERLALHAAITAGTVQAMFVDGFDGHWECLVDGPPIRELGQTLARARTGETAVSEHAERLLQAPASPATRGVEAIIAVAARFIPPERVDACRASIPETVVAHLDGDQTQWLAEFRTVTTLFVSVATREALAWMRAVARRHPVLTARTRYFEGLLSELEGDRDTATRALERALAIATKDRLRLDEAAALIDLVRVSPSRRDRDDYAARAEALTRTIDAPYYLDRFAAVRRAASSV
jgi:class 3 adenylate cyclase